MNTQTIINKTVGALIGAAFGLVVGLLFGNYLSRFGDLGFLGAIIFIVVLTLVGAKIGVHLFTNLLGKALINTKSRTMNSVNFAQQHPRIIARRFFVLVFQLVAGIIGGLLFTVISVWLLWSTSAGKSLLKIFTAPGDYTGSGGLIFLLFAASIAFYLGFLLSFLLAKRAVRTFKT